MIKIPVINRKKGIKIGKSPLFTKIKINKINADKQHKIPTKDINFAGALFIFASISKILIYNDAISKQTAKIKASEFIPNAL